MSNNIIMAQASAPTAKTADTAKPSGKTINPYHINIVSCEYGDGLTEGHGHINKDILVTFEEDKIKQIEFIESVIVEKAAYAGEMKDFPKGQYKVIFNYSPPETKIHKTFYMGNEKVALNDNEIKPEEISIFINSLDMACKKCINSDICGALLVELVELKKIQLNNSKTSLFKSVENT